MAGDWIAMRVQLASDKATLSICDRTGLDEFAVVGRLHAVWCWAGEHTADGDVGGAALSAIDRVARQPGFGAAMVAAGWLEELPAVAGSSAAGEPTTAGPPAAGGLRFPRWDDCNSESAKKRLMHARRAARQVRSNPAPEAQPERTRRARPAQQPGDYGAADAQHKRSSPAPEAQPERSKSAATEQNRTLKNGLNGNCSGQSPGLQPPAAPATPHSALPAPHSAGAVGPLPRRGEGGRSAVANKPAAAGESKIGAFAGLTEADLADTGRLIGWHKAQAARPKPVIGQSENDRINVLAAAEAALAQAEKYRAAGKPTKPVGIFGHIVGAKRCTTLTGDQLDKARARLREWMQGERSAISDQQQTSGGG